MLDKSLTAKLADSAQSRINTEEADVAQLVEQPIRNRQVIGSSPIVGSNFSEAYGSVHRRLLHNCCTSDFCFQLLHGVRHDLRTVLMPGQYPERQKTTLNFNQAATARSKSA